MPLRAWAAVEQCGVLGDADAGADAGADAVGDMNEDTVAGVWGREGVDTITILLAGLPSVSESLSMSLSLAVLFSIRICEIFPTAPDPDPDSISINLRDVEEEDEVDLVVVLVIVLWLTIFRGSSVEEPRNWHAAAGLT